METIKKSKFVKANRYEIRMYPEDKFSLSKPLGRKLYTYQRACKLVKRLKRMGIDAFKAKWTINIQLPTTIK